MKTCSKCHSIKPLTEYNGKAGVKYIRPTCRECEQTMRHLRDLKRLFGISAAEYYIRLELQNHVCAICKKVSDKRLCVEHDHFTGKIRGLSCNNCNLVLGYCSENVQTLLSAAVYLLEHNGETPINRS